MPSPIRLGIAGIGTVGTGVLKILQSQSHLIAKRSGRTVELVALCARSREKDRGVEISHYAWENDPVSLAARNDIDVFVELIGGSEGEALEAVKTALKTGKDVVTANKAMLALHGQKLAEKAEANDLVLRFEAAVAGGIPVIKSLMEGLAGNSIFRVMGVMNGTCNYILTRMQSAGLTYQDAFNEADSLGYLEADPNLDVGGIDAAHKLSLLSAIAFGTKIDFENIELEGIQEVTISDIRHAADMGFRIKLLGVTQITARGLEQRMSPCLVPANSPLGQLEGGTNMVVIEGDQVEQITLQGPGAGEGPTASAVMGDIIDIARGFRVSTFGIPSADMQMPTPARSALSTPYYLRMALEDKPGALAKVASELGNAGISINRMRQYRHDDDTAPVIIVTHDSTQDAIDQALNAIS
ncbi:MAG: homoserine dehydrogenase, partial [Roseovarius sp.]|nr:homoserine dehydrogenase [Roseovarius sp.]